VAEEKSQRGAPGPEAGARSRFRRIRVLPGPSGAIPIIDVSGRASEEDEAAAFEAGMTSYLRKPASPATLNARLLRSRC
jgi:CheY-like chemotaxis protein